MKHFSLQNGKKNTRQTGQWGEEVAAQYLHRQGFTLVERNYHKPWGEIDIIVRKNNTVHFVEVKSVSYETKQQLANQNSWRPEELVHQHKLRQIGKALETWLAENRYDGPWQIDVAAVKMVPLERYATVNYIENIVRE